VFDDKLNILQVDELVVGLIAFNLVAALLPASGTFVADPEVGHRLGWGWGWGWLASADVRSAMASALQCWVAARKLVDVGQGSTLGDMWACQP
jgi:hypothetical protein